MNLSGNDYKILYKLQDKVFNVLSGHLGELYLTGGTALGRFFLHHRYSDDLDFFTNNNPEFKQLATDIRRVLEAHFDILTDKLVFYDEYIRLWITDGSYELKIELVNDVGARLGEIFYIKGIPVDNPANILSNKLNAIVNRDEPKDVFDILSLSDSYAFNWAHIFEYTVQKAIVAEQDVAMRLSSFPVEWLTEQKWMVEPINSKVIKDKLNIIMDDFLFARDNSLGIDKPSILEARPVEKKY